MWFLRFLNWFAREMSKTLEPIYYILAKNLAMFCPRPKDLSEDELKSHGLSSVWVWAQHFPTLGNPASRLELHFGLRMISSPYATA